METDRLYRVQREDLPELEKLLTECFREDPLYQKLIPNEEIRKRLMPELFKCDLSEFYETCEIYADTKDLNSLLVVSDEAESSTCSNTILRRLRRYSGPRGIF